MKNSNLPKKSGGSSLGYLTKEGFKSIKANKLMSFASIAVLTSCLVMIGCSILVFLNIDSILGKIESQNIIMVFIEDDLEQNDIDIIGQNIRSIPNVKACNFISKDESYKRQLKTMGDDAELLSGLKNPLPNAYKVTLKSMKEFKVTVNHIKNVDNISNVRENSTLAKQLTKIRRAVTYISVGIIILLLTVSLFIIANTVRVTMHNRRLEISIMKAVGATNGFIRWPFIVEGIVLGVISSLISILITFGMYQVAISSLSDVLSLIDGNPINFATYAVQLLIGFLFVGVIAGTSGSIVSMNRYLKKNQGSVVSE